MVPIEGRSGSGGDEPVEQVVLGGFQLADLGQLGVAVAAHGLGVALGLAMGLLGSGSFRDQRPEAGLVGLVGEVGELLLGNGEITRDRPQAVRYVSQTPFDESAAHDGSLGTASRPSGAAEDSAGR